MTILAIFRPISRPLLRPIRAVLSRLVGTYDLKLMFAALINEQRAYAGELRALINEQQAHFGQLQAQIHEQQTRFGELQTYAVELQAQIHEQQTHFTNLRTLLEILIQETRGFALESRSSQERLPRTVHEIMARETDRLDGYLVHHVESLRQFHVEMANFNKDLGQQLRTYAEGIAQRQELAAIHNSEQVVGLLQQTSQKLEGLDAAICGLNEPLRHLLEKSEATGAASSHFAIESAMRHYVTPGGATVLMDEFDYIIPSDQVGLTTFLLRNGLRTLEAGVQALIRERLKSGKVAVDIGANFGLHTLPMAHYVGPAGRVICFEPNPVMTDALRRSAALNNMSGRVTVVEKAVHNRVGTAQIMIAQHSPMTSLFPLSSDSVSQVATVETVTLDAYFSPGTQVDFIKIDAEGAEPFIYEGMPRLLKENREIEIILEWSMIHFERAGTDAAGFFSQLTNDGFSAYLIGDRADDPLTLVDYGSVARLETANLFLSRTYIPPTRP